MPASASRRIPGTWPRVAWIRCRRSSAIASALTTCTSRTFTRTGPGHPQERVGWISPASSRTSLRPTTRVGSSSKTNQTRPNAIRIPPPAETGPMRAMSCHRSLPVRDGDYVVGVTTWGIISTARINEMVIAGAALSDEAEIVAVASRDQARADAYAAEHGISRGYGSYEALLADPEIEAVYISLPNSLHCEWSIKALEAGKHVLCQKPTNHRPDAVKAVFDAADANDRFCMEAFMWRHNPQTKKLKELVDEGAIGQPRVVSTALSFTLVGDADPRLFREMDGGALMDLGCYCVSGARFLLGEPVR